MHGSIFYFDSKVTFKINKFLYLKDRKSNFSKHIGNKKVINFDLFLSSVMHGLSVDTPGSLLFLFDLIDGCLS